LMTILRPVETHERSEEQRTADKELHDEYNRFMAKKDRELQKRMMDFLRSKWEAVYELPAYRIPEALVEDKTPIPNERWIMTVRKARLGSQRCKRKLNGAEKHRKLHRWTGTTRIKCRRGRTLDPAPVMVKQKNSWEAPALRIRYPVSTRKFLHSFTLRGCLCRLFLSVLLVSLFALLRKIIVHLVIQF